MRSFAMLSVTYQLSPSQKYDFSWYYSHSNVSPEFRLAQAHEVEGLMLTRGVVLAIVLVALSGLGWMLLGQADICRAHCPPLHVAARHGDLATMTRLLEKGADVNARAKSGTTALYLAAGAGQPEAVKVLLDHGACVEVGAAQGYGTPLFEAVSCRNSRASADVTRLLLQRGSNPNATMPGGQTPLILAAVRGRAEVVKLLLDAGASAGHRGSKGRTPLHHAAKTTSTETVRLLLDAGASVDEQDDNGVTALRLARTTAISELLISRGADVNHLCGDGWTPLTVAASSGDVRLVERLLCAGADPDLAGANGWTPLHHAAASGAGDCADLLLIAGAEPNPNTSDGWTPLALASDPQTVEILRRRGGKRTDATYGAMPDDSQVLAEALR